MRFYQNHSLRTKPKLEIKHLLPASPEVATASRGRVWVRSRCCWRSSQPILVPPSSRSRLCHLSFTPPLRVWGEAEGPDGSSSPSSILSAASSPPPTTLLHSWSYFHPLTPHPSSPSPVKTPEPRRSSVLHDWANTAPHQPSRVPPPLLPWLASSSDGSVTGETKEQLHQDGGVNDLTRLLVRPPAVQPP